MPASSARGAVPSDLPGSLILSSSRPNHRVDTRYQTLIVVSAFECGLQLIIDDPFAGQVGESALQSIASMDAHLAIGDEYKKDRTVVLLFLPDLPRVVDSLGEILHGRLRVHFREYGDHDLVRGLPFELPELFVECGCGVRRNDARVVVEIFRRLWR